MPEFLDETFEDRERREKFEYFFGQYSSDVRKNLLAKNIERPENLYDILYTKVRRDQLSKNEVKFSTDIDKTSESIRNAQLSSIIAKQIDLDKSGETIRRTQEGRNKLLESSVDLSNLADQTRGKLLSKNIPYESNLDKAAETSRDKNIAANQIKNTNLDDTAEASRSVALSKNEDKNIDLDKTAESQRNKQDRSNTERDIDLDKSGEINRRNNESKNISNEIDLDKRAAEYKSVQVSKNESANINLDASAEKFRDSNTAKNDAKEINLDKIGDVARSNNESFNKDSNIDLDKTASAIRTNLLSSNADSDNSIDKTADVARKNQLSQTNSKDLNLDKQAESIRNNQLSTNKDSENNLDAKSEIVREKLLSSNKESDSNIEANSEKVRSKILANNNDKVVDLDKAAKEVRNGLLSANVANNPDLDTSSQNPRNNLLASNVPTNINLDNSAQIPRNNLLASNVPSNTNLDNDSVAPRNSLLASNVPNNIDLDKDAKPVRNNLLSSNVNSNVDLDANAALARGTLLASNVPTTPDLDASAENVRQGQLASNQKANLDLEQNASNTRNALLAANIPSDNTIDRNANAIRDTLISANKTTDNQIENIADIFRHNLLTKNASSDGLGTNVYFGGTSTFIGVSNLEIISAPIRELTKLKNKIFDSTSPQKVYGLATNGDGIPTAKITNAIQLYNLQKNPFMTVRYSDKSSGYSVLANHNGDGFQQLLALGANINAEIKVATNTTPSDVITANQGSYLGLPTSQEGTSPVTILLKPEGNKTILGTAASMMGNTVPTDSIAANFNLKSRGVSHIINTIRAAGSKIPLANNYNSQTNNKFMIGDNKFAYARYTIANPYQPNKDAGVLELRIKNYAIANGGGKNLINTMSFPPYIKSFANSDSASWNKIDLLGRPEPIYTYSNSNREGSLSFYVLTDYAQVVDIGYDYVNSKPIQETFSKNFTDANNKKNVTTDIEVEISKRQETIAALNTQLADIEESDVANRASLRLQITEEQLQVNNLQAKLKNVQAGSDIGPNRKYKEFDSVNGNIYKSLIMNSADRDTSGNINLTTEATASRLKRMKENSLFQPAYFSGDKVDFLTRMEFLSKLTRPSRNSTGKGFAFSYPPVSHLQLGDWIDHDVIINNISYDYSDAPWTVDGLGGRTQPMWALVSLSFSIVGAYKGTAAENVPLSTDNGGFYQKRIK
jgi:hypothetical protein